MKCPVCGQELRPGKKDPNYLLCYNCKKKFKVPQKKVKTSAETDRGQVDEEEEQRYSNIPPKKVREKRETEMRKAYDELLAVEYETNKKKKRKPKSKPEPEEDILDDVYDDDYDYDDDDDYDYEDEGGSKLPIIILAIAIVIVGALIAYMLLFR